MRPLIGIQLDDEKAERARSSQHDAIRELQTQPILGRRILPSVSLANGVLTPVSHGLGRAPSFATASFVRGAVSAGYIVESRPVTGDRSQFLYLTANGYGSTVVVDIEVQ